MKFSGKIFGKLGRSLSPHINWGPQYLFSMKSSYASYSKRRKMGKKFALRVKQNNEVLKQVKSSDK
jgi:hypothetical protein